MASYAREISSYDIYLVCLVSCGTQSFDLEDMLAATFEKPTLRFRLMNLRYRHFFKQSADAGFAKVGSLEA